MRFAAVALLSSIAIVPAVASIAVADTVDQQFIASMIRLVEASGVPELATLLRGDRTTIDGSIESAQNICTMLIGGKPMSEIRGDLARSAAQSQSSEEFSAAVVYGTALTVAAPRHYCPQYATGN